MAPHINKPKQVRPGEQLTAAQINAIVELVLSRIQGGNGIVVKKVGVNRIVETAHNQIIPV